MSATFESAMIPLPEAAMRLRVTHRRAYDLLLRGMFGDPVRQGNRYMVSAKAVRAFEAGESGEPGGSGNV